MRAVVIMAHPSSASFTHALGDAAIEGLRERGATVRVHDLYADGFSAAMTHAERAAYLTDAPIVDELVRRYAADVAWADTFVFVYPTWWCSVPAVMKAWLERVLVPGVAFSFNKSGKVTSELSHIKRIIGISTYGADRRYVRLMTDGGRQMLTRSLRAVCGWTTRTEWHGLYAIDNTSAQDRSAFLQRVRTAVGPK
jgi:putative NADPH-quinone reductase